MANEILPFGLGAESNVMTQAEYEALAARSGGFSSGVAKSEQLNKVWRQSSFVASVLADFIAKQSGNNVLDDGNTAVLLANLELAIKKYAGSNLPDASLTQKGVVQLSSSITSTSEVLAATPKAVKAANDAALQKSANLSDLANAQTALTNLGLTGIGIGLPTQPTIANFDFQTFVFTSGANYAVSSSTWINVPVEVVYPTGIIISITVIFVPGSNVILKLVPHVSSAGKFNTYYVRMAGTVGSRTIYVIQDWNSANPIPISGGGTGATTTDGAIANLELGEGSLAPIGVPLPYPQATAPSGYLKCNGSSFSTTTYPRLALMYPSGVLPDLRGNVIRAWDDGRGIDSARALLTEQMGSYLIHEWTANNAVSFYSADGVGLEEDPIIGAVPTLSAKGATAVTTFTPVKNHLGIARMRNISFNYIVRAL